MISLKYDILSAITRSQVLINQCLIVGILNVFYSQAITHLAVNSNNEINSLVDTGIESFSQISRRNNIGVIGRVVDVILLI